MNGQQPGGQITFYDQLGVPANATAEEIREAYRALARLLHPDQQTDPHLKSVAEQQMRKLNPIYHVLSDPELRRRYDEDLEDHYTPPIILEPAPRLGLNRVFGRMAWLAAAAVAVGMLYWLTASGFPGSDPAPRNVPILIPAANAKPAPDDDNAAVSTLRSEVRTLTAERDFAMHELLRLKAGAPPESARSLPPAPAVQTRPDPEQTLTELPPAVSGPVAPAALPALKADTSGARPTLAGFWFYARPKDGQKNKNASLYVPEYIEATITERAGVLTGKYRSRFEVADRAIYPEVNFTFSGTAIGSTLTCPWTGDGGARGEVTLRMTSENAVRIDWAASELGTQQGLAQGTAVLIRRID